MKRLRFVRKAAKWLKETAPCLLGSISAKRGQIRFLRPKTGLIFGLGLLLLLSACDILLSGNPTPIPTVTPATNFIEFKTFSFRQTLEEGKTIPGTRLTFVTYQTESRTFEVLIDGQFAQRRSGDSFDWEGVLAPGVLADYELVLDTQTLGTPYTSGEVTVSVLNPAPVEADPTFVPPAADFQFEQLLIDYRIPIGREVPGTQLTFAAVTDNGAFFEGTRPQDYAYRRQGDALIWQGALSENVFLRYDLSVVTLSDSELRLRGTGTLWINGRR